MSKRADDSDYLHPEYDFSGGVRGKYAHHFTEMGTSAYTIPSQWIAKSTEISGIAKNLCADAFAFSSNVTHLLSAHVPTIPAHQFSALTSKISAASLGLDRLITSAETLSRYDTIASSLLVQEVSVASYLQVPSAIAATTAYLDTASALSSAIRMETRQLALLDLSSSYVSKAPDVQWPALAPTTSVINVNALRDLADRVKLNVSLFSNLMDTTLATSRATSEVFSLATSGVIKDYVSTAVTQLSELSNIGASVYTELASNWAIKPTSFLLSAPTIEPYAQIQATSVLVGIDDERRELQSVTSADAILDELGDELEERLSRVNPALAEAYGEGVEAIHSGRRGWIRHAGVSFRTMFDHLLNELGPSDALDDYLTDPESHKKDGEYPRSARLAYIFREVAVGSYTVMAEHDIKLAQATFFPANEIVHRLASPLTERQMKVLFRRIQGSVSVVLAAAGY